MIRKIAPVALLLLLMPGTKAAADLMMHFDVNQSGSDFSYTVFNDEPASSSLYISAFHLTVDAAFVVANSPAGWDYVSDFSTYIDWFNTDAALPYPNDIAPGSSLGGFTLRSSVTTSESLPFTASSWDHSTDEGGPSADGSVLAPSGAVVPEPSSLGMSITAALVALGYAWRRRRK